MCGLVGIIGDIYTNDVKVFKQLMHVNYLRGVHATGFVNVRSGNNDNLTFKRAYNPIELFDMKSADSALSISGSQALLGHCRQATVGASGSHQNAHPFTHGAVTMMHNGTLTSRTGLLGTGFAVDSEQICHTLSELNEADDFQELKWSIDAAFAVHPDMKSHTGSTFTMGKGAICSSSIKQKTNSRSSTESELIALDDIISKVLWTKRFVESQGFEVLLNVVYQDNTSTIKLAENGKASSGKRTRHFDIKYFYITDLIARDEVKIKYCPTEDMEADYMSKPTVGKKFSKFREIIMNLNTKS